jgi:hypothetical protein
MWTARLVMASREVFMNCGSVKIMATRESLGIPGDRNLQKGPGECQIPVYQA